MAITSTYTIDIGSDKYFLGDQRQIDLGFKGKQSFIMTFGSNPETEALLLKYFPFGMNYKNIPYESNTDLIKVRKIIKLRADQLNAGKKYNNMTLANMVTYKYSTELQKILQYLNKYMTLQTNQAVQQIETENITELHELSEERQFQLILEMAWYLIHPTKIYDTGIRRKWIDTVLELNNLKVDDILQTIKKEAETNKKLNSIIKSLGADKNPLKLLKHMNIGTLSQQETIKNIQTTSTSQLIDSIEREEFSNLLESRIRSILTILQTHRYIDSGVKIDTIIKNMNSASGNQFNVFSQTLDKELISKIDSSLDPIFVYLKNVYNPAYNTLYRFSEVHKLKPTHPNLSSILRLIHLANNWKRDQVGIIRLSGIMPDAIQFIKDITEFIVTGYEDELKVVSVPLHSYIKDLEINKLPSVCMDCEPGTPNSPVIEFYSGAQLFIPNSDQALRGIKEKVLNRVRSSRAIILQDIQNELKLFSTKLASQSIRDFFKKDGIYMICYNGEKKKTIPMVPYILMEYDMTNMPLTDDNDLTGAIIDTDYLIQLQRESPKMIDNSINFQFEDVISNVGVGINSVALSLITLLIFRNQLGGV